MFLTLAHSNVQVVVPIAVDIHDADAGVAVKGLASEIAMRRDKRGVAKRLAHQCGVARKPSPGAVLVVRERRVENFGKQRVRPREHLQRFGLPAANPPSSIFPCRCQSITSQARICARSPSCVCAESVKAQTGLVDRLLRVEKMPGLNVEGRIIPRIHRNQERPP